MRDDIAKKLVERPRYGGGGKYNLRSERRKGKNPEMWDSLPQKESCKKVNIRYYQGKYLNEYFPPLEGFLRKNVGRPWDKVNSEIRALLSPCSTTQKHVLDHLYRDFVETNPVWIDGKPHGSNFGVRGKHYPLRAGSFYVDQHGLLKRVKKAKKTPRYKPEPRKAINDFEEYRKINGHWFWVRYIHIFPGETGFDVVLGKEFKVGPWGCYELTNSNGDAHHNRQRIFMSRAIRLCVEKRQVSKQTIKAEGLNRL